MKSKLTMLTLVGALALSAAAPMAMAKNQKGASAVPSHSIAPKKVVLVKATTGQKTSGNAWIPNHTLPAQK